MARTGSLTEGPLVLRSPSKSLKVYVDETAAIRTFFRLCQTFFSSNFIDNALNSQSLSSFVKWIDGVLIKHVFAHIMQMSASPRYASIERRGVVPGDLLLNKLDEVNKSVKVSSPCLYFIFLCGADKNNMIHLDSCLINDLQTSNYLIIGVQLFIF